MNVFIKKAVSAAASAAIVAMSFAPAVAPLAHADAPVRKFSASTSPTNIGTGGTQVFTVTFTNDPSSSDDINSARLTLPSGFTLQNPPTPTLGGVTNWEVCSSGTEIQFGANNPGGLGITPGSSFTLTFTANVAASAGNHTFVARAFKNQSCNPGGGAEFDSNLTPITITIPQCNDNIDNDGDGFVDFDGNGGTMDPGCTDATDNTESPNPAPATGTLTLQKTVLNDSGTGAALDTAWTLSASGATPISGIEGAAAVTAAVVTAGNYDLSESGGPAGYTASAWACTGGTQVDADTVTVAASGSVTCVITNDDVPPGNTAPVANPQSVITAQDTATSSVLTGSDANLDTLTFGIVSGPANGLISVFIAVSGAFTYTPNAGFFGPDSFTFQVNDGTASSSAATVSITVNAPGNNAPVANNLAVTTAQDTATSSAVTGSDADLDTLTFGTTTNPASGALVFNQDGTFTYTPNAGFFGADSFAFEANDGTASSSPATVSITVSQAQVVTPAVTECNDGQDNDGNGDTDAQDPECHTDGDAGNSASYDPNDNNEDQPSRNSGGGSRRSSGSSSTNSGEVLGAETGPGECVEYLLAYIKAGENNDAGEVAKLQIFLNNFEGNNLAITGTYNSSTVAAVNAFQAKYAADVLTPWGLKGPTGWVYYTTRKQVNTIFCEFEKEFPLTAQQLADIAYIKARQGTFSSQGQVAGASTAAPAAAPAKSPATGTVLPTTKVDQNATPAATKATQTASTATATSTGGWWTSFVNWLFGK